MALIFSQNNKSPSTKQVLTIIVTQFLLLLSISQQLIATDPSAYELLGDYDFPVGILPKGVTGYQLDASTGKFSVFLNGSCSFSLEGSYQLNYKSTIKGYISKGKLSSLEGISVKLLFVWVNIIEVSRSGDDLNFSVGIAGAGFPLDNFEESPQCGCGFDCGDSENKGIVKIEAKRNPFVSSV